jgi:catechol 2,3-dioxygenase-like lactoylglutathione lyase family enzyme
VSGVDGKAQWAPDSRNDTTGNVVRSHRGLVREECARTGPEGGPVLHLAGDPRPAGGVSRCVPNILVDDFDATLAEMKQRGVEICVVQEEGDDSYRLATIVDLDGNQINLYVSVG